MPIKSLINKLSIRKLFTLVLVSGITAITIISTLTLSYINIKSTEDTLINEGKNLSLTLESQSMLSLLYNSESNAKEILDSILQYPDVSYASIVNVNGETIAASGGYNDISDSDMVFSGNHSRVINTKDNLVFMNPVLITNSDNFFSDGPDDSTGELIGYVLTVLSKQRIKDEQALILVTNASITFGFLIVFVVIIRLLTNYITKPLLAIEKELRNADLSNGLRVSIPSSGSTPEIASIINAFSILTQKLANRDLEINNYNMSLQKQIHLLEVTKLALTKSEAQHRAVINNIGEGLITIDKYGGILSVNPITEELFEYSSNELIGRDISCLMPKNIQLHHNRFISRYMLTNKKRILGTTTEFTGVTKSGNEIPIEISISEMRQGDDYTFIGVVRDITERKLIEENQEKIKNEALELAKTKSDFLANMSHEIRTPINGVLGMLDILSETDLEEEQRSYLKIAKNSGNLLLSVINDILDFTKLDADNINFESISLDIHSLLKSMYPIFENSAEENNNTINIQIDESIPKHIVSDPTRIQQILFNLISNSIKFTTNGSIQVSANRHIDNTIKISVRDNGIGIEEGAINKIFDSFSQADTSTTRKYGGTGLGLSICKKIINKMGGEIGVNSDFGKGSEFWFTLPLVDATSHEISHKENVATMDKSKHVDSNVTPSLNLTILIAEDNLANQIVLSSMLQKLNCNTVVANNGQEVIDLIIKQEKEFDLIFMDCQMPILDGYDATVEIRKNEELTGNHIPIFALSADVLSAEERALSSGMDRFIQKPINFTSLTNVLVEHVSINKPEKSNIIPIQGNPTVTNNVPVDEKVLSELQSILGPDFNMMVSSYLDDGHKYINNIEDAINVSDFKSAAQFAHTLKGSSSNVGANTLSNVTFRLMTLLQSNNMPQDELTTLVRSIRNEFTEVENYLLTIRS